MTVISKRVFRLLPGKTEQAHQRIRRLGDALARQGGTVRICNVAWGDGARDVHLYGSFQNMTAGAKAFTTLATDADAVKLRSESENEPYSVWEGPEVWRTVFGEPQPGFSVMLQREYKMDRRHLKQALELLPEVQALRTDRPVIGVIPVVSDDMSRLMVGYYATSLVDLGEMIDGVGMSEGFQKIVVRAAEFGTLVRARAIVNV